MKTWEWQKVVDYPEDRETPQTGGVKAPYHDSCSIEEKILTTLRKYRCEDHTTPATKRPGTSCMQSCEETSPHSQHEEEASRFLPEIQTLDTKTVEKSHVF